MAKKIVAKTSISYGKKDGEQVDFVPGDEVNASELGMTKAQLEQLYDAGAIELQETADAREDVETKDEEEKAKEKPEPVKAPATKTEATSAKVTTSGVKSGDKSNPA